jgi:hypothetical protein
MQFLVEATTKDLTPFAGAEFSEPLVYSGKTLMNESNRNSFAEFAKYKKFTLSTEEKCLSRTAGGPSDIRLLYNVSTQVGVNKNINGTLSFAAPGTVLIRIVWSTKPPPNQGCTGVWVNEACNYTVKQAETGMATISHSANTVILMSIAIAICNALMMPILA